jgi:hypothetical protein
MKDVHMEGNFCQVFSKIWPKAVFFVEHPNPKSPWKFVNLTFFFLMHVKCRGLDFRGLQIFNLPASWQEPQIQKKESNYRPFS